MEHDILMPLAIGTLIAGGAFLLLRMGVKEFLQGTKDVLQEIGEFIKWFRIWKDTLWPPPK